MSVTLDTLAFDSDLLIQREIDLPVSLNLCARPGVGLATSARSCRSRTRSRSAAAGWPRSCPRPRAGRRTPPPTRRARCRSRSAPTWPRSATRSRPRSTASTCSPARSRTIPRTRPGSCSSGGACPRRPGTTRRRSSASSAKTSRVRCCRSCRSSRPGRSTSPSWSRARPSAGSATTASSSTARATSPTRCVADALRNLVAKQAEVKFLGSYPVGGPGRGGRRDAARPRARRGRARPRGSRRCATQIREPE